MSTYTTVSGDMWDAISLKVYGSTAYTGKLMANNSDYLADNYVFPAGIVLNVPEIEMQDETLDMLPPWRR